MLEIILWYTAVFIGFMLAIIFWIQYLKRDSLQKPFFLALSAFAICYAVARLIENIRRYSIGSYNDIFNAWVAGTQITGLNFWLRFLYYLIAWIGISIMYFNIERFIFKKNKFILTIFSIIEGVVSIVNYFTFNLVTFWISTALFFVVMFMAIMFLNLATKTPAGPMRTACIFITIGIGCLIIGVMIDLPEYTYFNYMMGQDYMVMQPIIRIAAPILLIVGLLILSLGFKQFFPKD